MIKKAIFVDNTLIYICEFDGEAISFASPKFTIRDKEVIEVNGVYYLADDYKSLRANEYPSIEEQMDMQYWDDINGTTIWKDTIYAIKVKYPKE